MSAQQQQEFYGASVQATKGREEFYQKVKQIACDHERTWASVQYWAAYHRTWQDQGNMTFAKSFSEIQDFQAAKAVAMHEACKAADLQARQCVLDSYSLPGWLTQQDVSMDLRAWHAEATMQLRDTSVTASQPAPCTRTQSASTFKHGLPQVDKEQLAPTADNDNAGVDASAGAHAGVQAGEQGKVGPANPYAQRAEPRVPLGSMQ